MPPDQPPAARLDSARELLRAAPGDARARLRFARLLRRAPDLARPADESFVLALLSDPLIAPQSIAPAGWALLRDAGRVPEPTADPERSALWLDRDELALALLAEAPVTLLPVELALTALRRWLLLSGRSAAFPCAVNALCRQAALNGGAWPFDLDERAALDGGTPMAPAYLPPRRQAGSATFASPVTRAVAAQYEAWPYPAWRRSTDEPNATLATAFAALGPGAPLPPPNAEILVAGCGTGREAALWARRAPEARVTAVDLSAASLRYAADRCTGIGNIDFEQRDLHDVAGLGRRFDMIICSGVLHHLPDPEAGWAALVDVLKPGGVMRIMVYSRVARLLVASALVRLGDLASRAVSDDLLRDVRARLIADPPHPIVHRSPDFYDLGGVHDLLLHAHEDAFDIPRIRRGVERLGLDFLGFGLPSPDARRRYRAAHPHDPWRRDFDGWAATERRDPQLFSGMYQFWCAKPGTRAAT